VELGARGLDLEGRSRDRARATSYDPSMQEPGRSEALDALEAEYVALDRVITRLSEENLLTPSGCSGWTNADLIFHMLLDAQRALVTFNSPAEGPATKDFVSYWTGFEAANESARVHARFVRISAAAHSDPKAIASRWHETALAAIRNARSTSQVDFVTTQGHVLSTPDFIATLVVEATIHHLDLVANLDTPSRPPAAALVITSTTLDGLLQAPRPDGWDEIAYLLKATGRESLTQRDRVALGNAASRLPLFS
jgi:uncharacterized protein (TIGR03083 family)